MEISMEKLEALLSVAQVADLFEVPRRIVRAAARKGEIPGAISVLGRIGFDPDQVTSWTPPEGGERAAKREDGRRKYNAWLTPEEKDALVAQGFELVDPRVASKARREARKAAKAEAAGSDAKAETPSEGDPFNDFG